MKKNARGFALVEVMIASAVLLFAMVGISLTTITMARDRGMGATQLTAGQLANEYLNEYMQWGLAALPTNGPDGGLLLSAFVQPTDAGTTNDNHVYQLSVYAVDSSATVGATSKMVTVTVTYIPTTGSPVTQTVNGIVSR